jgi:hypothetical protein
MRTPQEREDALRKAARGIDLDAHEELMLAGFAHSWGAEVTERVCSLLEKVREAGYLTALTERADALSVMEAPAIAHPPAERGRWVAGNSGPGF